MKILFCKCGHWYREEFNLSGKCICGGKLKKGEKEIKEMKEKKYIVWTDFDSMKYTNVLNKKTINKSMIKSIMRDTYYAGRR